MLPSQASRKWPMPFGKHASQVFGYRKVNDDSMSVEDKNDDQDASTTSVPDRMSRPAYVYCLLIGIALTIMLGVGFLLGTLSTVGKSLRHGNHAGTSTETGMISAHFPTLAAAEDDQDFLTPRPWNYSTPSPCGSTPQEARTAGCRWSAMTFAWYPAACYDEELDQQFLRTREWEWFADEELSPSERISKDVVLRGDLHRAFMSMEYHKLHCMFTVRKLYRALFGMALSDTYILRAGHLEHCERFVMRNDTLAVKGVAKYLDCVDLAQF